MKKQRTKIPVKHYTEISATSPFNGATLDGKDCYITNEGGKTYLVEVWR